jgi:hypothetical protein
MKISSDKRAIDKIYKRRNRYDIPDWQRQQVWDRSKKQQLIDSILRGWNLPKFYFVKTASNPEQYEVVDGQQRLSAIFEFFDNSLPLSARASEEFGGEYYRELPVEAADAFDDFEIQFDLIEEAEERNLKEFFQRLQEGLPLTSSEKLNSVHSKLRDFVKSLTHHRFFKEKVSLSDRRFAHFDVAAKVAAIEIDGIDTGLRFDDLRDLFEAQATFSSRSGVAQRLRETYDFLDSVFPDTSTILKNRTVIQSIATLVARFVKGGRAAGREKEIGKFFAHFAQELGKQVELGQAATDQDYVRFQRSVNANVRSGARTRQDVLVRKMLTFNAALVELFDASSLAEAAASAQLREIGDNIRGLVAMINSAYSAENGSDLFKATNRTTQALTRIEKRVMDMAGYQTLIDDLYFLFHEAVGERLGDRTPESFSDVNALRTDLQHDVDHGKQKKVRSKRKAIASVFERYAGVASPATLAPEGFPLVQANLLAALESDLRTLPNTILRKGVV